MRERPKGKLLPRGPQSVGVAAQLHCDSKSWLDSKEDFYRNWSTYREGFGSLHGDFFLGLEKIHRLTRAQPHELYVHMEGFDLDLISLGKSEGSATADRLQYHKHQKFTTFDRDNDNYTYLWQLRKRKQILWWLVVPFTAIDRHSFVKTI
ncbi:uncharacterized protein Dvir_GJ25987 [Drosophila virilis]|uniref:Fibrinogen C-terminal domain-containing protein n=1 Tax=Drosophila virilis TaxID=7244 RepID=A0A0Q9WL07_DROVI|nr:uncharacterized protein Dvir_GJ25987 [Drosophila virilis]